MNVTGTRRALMFVVAVLLGPTVLGACLAPDAPDPTGHAPFGSLELIAQSGAGVRVAGWAIDPDTSAPVDVQVKVEGQDLRNVRADRDRPDVGAAYPGRGTSHGFDLTVPDLGPGKRQVCVWIQDVGVGGDTRVLGCRDIVIAVDPFGTLESVTAGADGTVRARGWVLDPETSAATDVGIVMDGATVVVQPTDIRRDDVDAVYSLGAVHGFDISFPASVGRHTVCAVAGNVGWGSATFTGCADVVVAPPDDRRPDLRLTAVEPVGADSARIRGTVSDPDGPGPIQIRVTVDGGTIRSSTAVGGDVDLTVTGLARGRHELCVWAVDIPGVAAALTGDRLLPCSTVVLAAPGGLSAGTVGAATGSTGVGPAAGDPLQNTDRDAGISVRLRDGSTLWLFGDTSATDATGAMTYFVNNTAAWAPVGSPAVTRDAVVGGRPQRFVAPTEDFHCPAGRPTAAMWPISAVATPSGGRDLVTAFFADMCLGSAWLDFESHGVTVVQWTYDPASPPDGRPITGTVRAPDLFPADDAYGTAAVAVADPAAGSGDDGWFVYGYQCDAPLGDGPFWPGQYGPCTLGRVPVASVDQRSQWRFWNGGGWVGDRSAAAPVVPTGGSDPQLPVASLTVTRDDVLGAYVMAYSPWPGFIGRAYVRVAPTPIGPWSDALPIDLPGCADRVAGTAYACYGATAQPQFSSPGRIGIGWYDQLVSAAPVRGQYRVSSVPFSVAPGA